VPEKSAHVLIADDQLDVQEALRLLFKAEGYKTQAVGSPAAVLELLGARDFDLLIMDLNYSRDTTSGEEGLALLGQVRALRPEMPVVVMTAWGSIELAVEAMRRGAQDFIQKPWENPRVLTIARTQIELRKARDREQKLEAQNAALREVRGSTFIAESPAMRPVLEVITRVGPADANVLLAGESGTGKGVVAHALHARSKRAAGPFVTVNMGGISEGVFDSELFGHVKGAFTDARADRMGRFELAEGGTLFLDEIANLPMAQQTKLLRVLETGEFERVGSSKTDKVDVRLIAATNADLRAEVSAGRFRQDLLFRLNTIEVHIPPLRERPEDIPLLARHFIDTHCQRYRKTVKRLDDAARDLLLKHSWPGNVRELDHVLERAVLMARDEVLQAGDLGLDRAAGEGPRLDDMSIEEVERFLIKKTLARFEGSAQKAAEALGLSRSAFYRRLEKYGL
jgi:DNA-binding NtrC family response regulator